MGLPLAVAAIPSAFKALTGIFQASKGNRMLRNLRRPEYEIPDAVREAVAISRRQANTNMPAYNLAQQNIGLSQANLIEASRQGAGGGIGNVAAIQAGTNQAYQQLGAQNAQYNVQMQDNLKNALGVLANYRDKEWQLNKFAPYQDRYNRAQGLIQGGNTNLSAGLSGLSSLATAKIQADSNASIMEEYLNPKTPKYTSSPDQSTNPLYRPSVLDSGLFSGGSSNNYLGISQGAYDPLIGAFKGLTRIGNG